MFISLIPFFFNVYPPCYSAILRFMLRNKIHENLCIFLERFCDQSFKSPIGQSIRIRKERLYATIKQIHTQIRTHISYRKENSRSGDIDKFMNTFFFLLQRWRSQLFRAFYPLQLKPSFVQFTIFSCTGYVVVIFFCLPPLSTISENIKCSANTE